MFSKNNSLISKQDLYDFVKENVNTGTESKILQFFNETDLDSNDELIKPNSIQLLSLLKTSTMSVIMINIESHSQRYHACLDEFSKLNIVNFIHLKATYWKERSKFIKDLNFIYKSMRPFNSSIADLELSMNNFSEINDPNILIQDGPLACYCSHVRALLYGYHSNEDFFMIVEDDLYVKDTELITEAIKNIPQNWDILLFGSHPLNKKYTSKIYKLEDEFHSLHFYIVKKSAVPIILSKIYPITDQIDVLLSRLHSTLNIYNIEGSAKQKDFVTNTQNNLSAMLTIPTFNWVKDILKQLHQDICLLLEEKLPRSNVKTIGNMIIFDLIFKNIVESEDYVSLNNTEALTTVENMLAKEFNGNLYRIFNSIFTIFITIKKGDNSHVRFFTLKLISAMIDTIKRFTLHDTSSAQAFSYGTNYCIYFLQNTLISKVSITDSCKIDEYVYPDILISDNIILYEKPHICLIEEFKLPPGWRNQIIFLFKKLDQGSFYFNDFNLRNIYSDGNNLRIIDFTSTKENVLDYDYHMLAEEFIEIMCEISQQFDNITPSEYYTNYITYVINKKDELQRINLSF